MSWHDILQKPWIGHGPTYQIDRPGESFPHNLFLSTWLYTGVVGLSLLALYLLSVLHGAWRASGRAERALNLAVLLYILINAMTDYGQVIKGPGPMWYIFWLPTLLAGISPRAKPTDHARNPGAENRYYDGYRPKLRHIVQ